MTPEREAQIRAAAVAWQRTGEGPEDPGWVAAAVIDLLAVLAPRSEREECVAAIEACLLGSNSIWARETRRGIAAYAALDKLAALL